MLLNNPGNQPDCHIPFFINPGDNKANLIFLPGSAVIVAAVGDGVDADGEPDKDRSFVDIGYGTGILPLNLAPA